MSVLFVFGAGVGDRGVQYPDGAATAAYAAKSAAGSGVLPDAAAAGEAVVNCGALIADVGTVNISIGGYEQ